jgi:hypothetical protein
METPVSPALTMSSIRPHSSAINNMEHSSLADLHSSLTLHVVSVLNTHALLCEVYSLLWQSVRSVQCSSQMSHRREIRTNSTRSGSRNDARQYGPPDPEPPAAPPYVLYPSVSALIHHRTSHTNVLAVSLTNSTQNHHPFPIWQSTSAPLPGTRPCRSASPAATTYVIPVVRMHPC